MYIYIWKLRGRTGGRVKFGFSRENSKKRYSWEYSELVPSSKSIYFVTTHYLLKNSILHSMVFKQLFSSTCSVLFTISSQNILPQKTILLLLVFYKLLLEIWTLSLFWMALTLWLNMQLTRQGVKLEKKTWRNGKKWWMRTKKRSASVKPSGRTWKGWRKDAADSLAKSNKSWWNIWDLATLMWCWHSRLWLPILPTTLSCIHYNCQGINGCLLGDIKTRLHLFSSFSFFK